MTWSVDRRPLQFWVEFNEWARCINETFGRKPSVKEIKEWYNLNAASVWPDPETRPTLLDAKRHAKGIRAKGTIAAYFRQYRLRKAEREKRVARRRKKRPGYKPAGYGGDDSESEDAAPGRSHPRSRPQRSRCKPSRYRLQSARLGSIAPDTGSESEGPSEGEDPDLDDGDDDEDEDDGGDDIGYQDQRAVQAVQPQPALASGEPQQHGVEGDQDPRCKAEETAHPGSAEPPDSIHRPQTRVPAPRGRRPRMKREAEEPPPAKGDEALQAGTLDAGGCPVAAFEPFGDELLGGGAPGLLWPLGGGHWQDGPQPTGPLAPNRLLASLLQPHPVDPLAMQAGYVQQPPVLAAPLLAAPQPQPTATASASRRVGAVGRVTAAQDPLCTTAGDPESLMDALILAATEATAGGPRGPFGDAAAAAAWAAAEALFLPKAVQEPPPPHRALQPQPQAPRRRTPSAHIGNANDVQLLADAALATAVPFAASPALDPPESLLAAGPAFLTAQAGLLRGLATVGMGPARLPEDPFLGVLLGLGLGAKSAAVGLGGGLTALDPSARLLDLCAGEAMDAGLVGPYSARSAPPARGPRPGLFGEASRAGLGEEGARRGGSPGPRKQRQTSPKAEVLATASGLEVTVPAGRQSPTSEAGRDAAACGGQTTGVAASPWRDEGLSCEDGRCGSARQGTLSGESSAPQIPPAVRAGAAAVRAGAAAADPTAAAPAAAAGDVDLADALAGGVSVAHGPGGAESGPEFSRRPLTAVPGDGASPDRADGDAGDDGDPPVSGPVQVLTGQPHSCAAAAATAAATTTAYVSGAALPAAAAHECTKASIRKRAAAADHDDEALGLAGRAAAGSVNDPDPWDAVAAGDDLRPASKARTSAGRAHGQRGDHTSEAALGQAAAAGPNATAAPPRKVRRTASPSTAAKGPDAAAGSVTPTGASRRNLNLQRGPNPESDRDPGSTGLGEDDFPLTGLPSAFRLASTSDLRSGGCAFLDRALGAAAGPRTRPSSLTFPRGRWPGPHPASADWTGALDDPLDGALPLEDGAEEGLEDVRHEGHGGERGATGYLREKAPAGEALGGRRSCGGSGGTSLQDGVSRGQAARAQLLCEAAAAGPRRARSGQARRGEEVAAAAAAAWIPLPHPPLRYHSGGGLGPYGPMPTLGLNLQELSQVGAPDRLPYDLPGVGYLSEGSLACAGRPTAAELAMLVDWHLATLGSVGMLLADQPAPLGLAPDLYGNAGLSRPEHYPGLLQDAVIPGLPVLSATGGGRVLNGAFVSN